NNHNNLSYCLHEQGKYAQAVEEAEKGLAIRQKTLGEQHRSTAASFSRLAASLSKQGKHAEAARQWEKALLGYEFGRLQASVTGFDRALFRSGGVPPHACLGACLVRLGQPVQAWQHAESDLARGLLDDLLVSTDDGVAADRLARLRGIEQALFPLLGR